MITTSDQQEDPIRPNSEGTTGSVVSKTVDTPRETKDTISNEESFRRQVREDRAKREPPSSFSKRIWAFLNTSFGIWFLSTIIVGLVTFFYNERQRALEQSRQTQEASDKNQAERLRLETERAARNASLIATLLPYLAGKDPKQLRVSIAVTEYLKEKGELPGELEATLIGIAKNPNIDAASPEQSQEIRAAAAAVIDIPSKSEGPNDMSATGLPARLYVQIANESQRALAKELGKFVSDKGFLVPGIENIEKKASAPAKTEVRYYRDDDLDEANGLIALLLQRNIDINRSPVKVQGGRARPRHFELWFGR